MDLVDEDGTFVNAGDAHTVIVDNVNPTIVVSGNARVNEGSVHTVNLGAITDPGADTVTQGVVRWGDGNEQHYTSGAKTHTYADGPNNFAILVDLKDEDGTHLNRGNAFGVTVDNVDPDAHASGESDGRRGHLDQLFDLGSFGDPGTDSPWQSDRRTGETARSASRVRRGDEPGPDRRHGPHLRRRRRRTP